MSDYYSDTGIWPSDKDLLRYWIGRYNRETFTPIKQRILASDERNDGHNDQGILGDCLRACIAGMLQIPYEAVPHFTVYRNWYEVMRLWARQFDGDFGCFEPQPGRGIRHCFDDGWGPNVLIASGRSPRGPWLHSVLVDRRMRIVHDPHPSGDGLAGRIQDVITWCAPYQPAPYLLQLTR